jgi:PrsW family intramembrane metalloprotease
LDAIVKYFAAGFFLSASLALFWEVVAAAVINTFVSLLLAILGVDRVGDPQSDMSGGTQFGSASFLPSFSNRPSLLSRLYGYSGMDDPMSVKRPDYATVFGMDHPLLYTIYILFATFVVAGFIEELCKYFGYRMVEHPDFFTREELEESSMILQSSSYIDEDDSEGQERGDRAQPTVVNFSKQGQSIQARGAAITLAMVSVAIGFACCENLIYIFFYAGNSFMLELGVLIERSCFPVHPILAAIQSVRVCERDLEGSRSMKLGRIILPAVLFHGTFDFFIVFISFIGRLVGQGVEDGDLRISNTAEFLSVVSCVVIMFAALMYLYNESGKQRERLAALDFEATVDRSSLL